MSSIYSIIAEAVENSKERIFNGLTGYDVEVVNSDFLILQLRKLAEEENGDAEPQLTVPKQELTVEQIREAGQQTVDLLNRQREAVAKILIDRLDGYPPDNQFGNQLLRSLADEIVKTINEMK